MRGRRTVSDEVGQWLEGQLQVGRFKVGDAFPSERVVSERLQVSRGVVREAKARLTGQGILVQDRWRSRIARRDGPSVFRDWVREEATLRQALELRRAVFPEIFAAALRKSSDVGVTELVEAVTRFRTLIWLRPAAQELADAHEVFLISTAARTSHPVFLALAAAVTETLGRLPIWEAMLEDRTSWQAALDELKSATQARKSARARGVLRQHLRVLDAHLLAAVRSVEQSS